MKEYTLRTPPDYTPPAFPMGKALCAELRNPETKQIQGQLKTSQGECCLGVLCRIQGRFSKIQGFWLDAGETTYYLADSNPSYSLLGHNGKFPPCVCVVYGEVNIESLAELNDERFTFTEVADIIEKIWNCQ